MLDLANVTTSDGYTSACTLGPVPTAKGIRYLVANASVLMQVAPRQESGTIQAWSDEILIAPESNSIDGATGVRFRSAVAGTPAQVVAQLFEPADAELSSGTPFAGQLNPSGQIGTTVQIPEVALASWPPANPVEQQVVVLVLPSTYDPVSGHPLRWLCQYDASLAMWHVLGGAPVVSQVLTAEATASLTYADLATAGPVASVPRGGDYLVELHADMIGANSGAVSFNEGAVILASDTNAGFGGPRGASPTMDSAHTVSEQQLGTGRTVTMQYKIMSGTTPITFQGRRMLLWPLRIF